MPRSSASLQQRMASIATPAEFGESSTESFTSISISKTLRPRRIAGDEYRDIVDETEASFERTTGVEAGRLFRADRKIIDHEFRRGIPQFGYDLFASGFLFQRQECPQGVLVLHV